MSTHDMERVITLALARIDVLEDQLMRARLQVVALTDPVYEEEAGAVAYLTPVRRIHKLRDLLMEGSK